MKSLFFLYLLALGVFGWHTYTRNIIYWYDFNVTENTTKQTNFLYDDDLPNISLYISISEEYHNSTYQDEYRSWLTFTSPNIPDFPVSSSSSAVSSLSHAFRIGPCGFPTLISSSHLVNISHIQEVQNYTSKLRVLLKTTIEYESTQLDLPHSSEFVCDGLMQYRTIKILPWDIYQENKDFVITLSTPLRTDVSDYISRVFFMSEDQCNSTDNFPDYSEARFNISIPLNYGSSHNITVPAKEIWYISFVTLKNLETINVDFKMVDRPSPAFIPSLNLSVIVLLILSLFVYRQ